MDFKTEITKGPLTLDGAMGTALELQGFDTNTDLWTAKALITDPQKVYRVHYDYFKAGARATITDTYQANVQAFMKKGYDETISREIIAKAVKLARKARNDFEAQTGRHNYVIAGIGPYGAYLADGSEYRGDYELSLEAYQDFHQPRLEAVIRAGVDVIGIETQPKLSEVCALLEWLKVRAPEQIAYVTFSLKDPATISEGTSLVEAVKKVSAYPNVVAVGANCIPLEQAQAALEVMQPATDLPLVIYPNSGAKYDPHTKTWTNPTGDLTLAKAASGWYQAGARLIGGCCTTTVKDIEPLAQVVQNLG